MIGTRILKPFRSAGVRIGLVELVIWRKPLSHIFSMRDQAALVDLAAHVGAELAVHRAPDRGVVLEGEADAVDRGDRHQDRQDQARQAEEVDRAGAKLRQHVGVGAELVVREKLDVHAPPVAALMRVAASCWRTDMRMGDRRVVGEFVGEIGGAGAARQDRDRSERGGGNRAAHEPAAADLLHGWFPPPG